MKAIRISGTTCKNLPSFWAGFSPSQLTNGLIDFSLSLPVSMLVFSERHVCIASVCACLSLFCFTLGFSATVIVKSNSYVCIDCVYVSFFIITYAAFRLNDALPASCASNYIFCFRCVVNTSLPNLLWLRSHVRLVHLLTILSRPVCAALVASVLA